MKKLLKISFYAFVAFLAFKACTGEDAYTFEGRAKYDLLAMAESKIESELKSPESYKRIDWVANQTSDSTATMSIEFTAKNGFGAEVRNESFVKFKFDLDKKTARIINFKIK